MTEARRRTHAALQETDPALTVEIVWMSFRSLKQECDVTKLCASDAPDARPKIAVQTLLDPLDDASQEN